MTFRRALAPLALLSLVVAGCGGGGDGAAEAVRTGTPAAALSLAAVQERTEAANTARAAFSVESDVRGVPDAPEGPFSMTAEGLLDLVEREGTFTMTLPSDFGGKFLPFDGRFEVVLAGDTVYMKVPEGLGMPTPWASFSVTDGAGAALGAGGMPGISELFSPDMGLGLLDDLSSDGAETVGRETVRGVDATHYRVTVEPGDAGDDTTFESLGSFPLDLWVDDDGRLRKVTAAFDLAELMKAMFEGLAGAFGALGSSERTSPTMPSDLSMRMAFTFEVWDFGAPVDVEVPPADQVTDGSSLLGSSLSS